MPEIGEVIELDIRDVGSKGDGIGKVGTGLVVIVKGAQKGQRVKAKIIKNKDTYLIAELVEILPVESNPTPRKPHGSGHFDDW